MEKTFEVRGHTSYNSPTSKPIKFLSQFGDCCIVLLLCVWAAGSLNIQPVPRPALLGLLILLSVVYWLPQKLFFNLTAGYRLWDIRFLNGKLLQCDHFSPVRIFVSCFATTVIALLTFSSTFNYVFSNPLWMPTELWKMEPYLPTSDKWLVAPYFYALGGWPKEFGGKPIYTVLPYEKGPPTRFVGHIVANWNGPEIQLIMEGPKTPLQGVTQREIRNCILRNTSYDCLLSKEASLARHLKEIREISPDTYSLKWFTVDNPTIPQDEQTQGIYLSAQGSHEIQDRFILINANGSHQAILLKRPKSPQGLTAFDLLQKTIRSLRTFNDLDAGRAWVNREIQNVKLTELNSITDPLALRSKLAEIQSILISRISVEPASFDSYYHLAGTSLMLAKNSRSLTSEVLELPLYSARKNLDSSLQFAKDISASDPRTKQIEALWNESKKL